MLNIDDSRTSSLALQEIEKIKNEFDTGKSFEELAGILKMGELKI